MQSRFKQIKYLLADMTFTLKLCNFIYSYHFFYDTL